ncbi:arsenite efflux MFS transporter ArsK [Chelativorans sp. AA-79]|uniref:arsenite efflux MFS transporter ArsK n=1 Tax=Chelativorans sp. AA-79 TaxID=3028735 RepID=UPI0023F8F7DE|nr:arsenite efflux MFS transporter ArsK [Chelativorans sp. AA-79]WEX11048.1 arsenite efflux MFS transporter ArsK [Chelativorans sp. AA-79]
MTGRIPASAIWALGLTQIIGYGTLYYSFSVLAPAIGATFDWTPEWTFGALTIALLAGGLVSPLSGHMVDKWGAAPTMTVGSLVVGLALVLMGVAANGYLFAFALIFMEATSTLVLYAAAFAALVQLGGRDAQRSITHLTLIAGFASTIFWPLTAALLSWMDWRTVYLVFAAMNVLVCAPLHFWLGRIPRPALETERAGTDDSRREEIAGSLPPGRRSFGFALVLAAFAFEGVLMSAVTLQMVPLLTTLGLGSGMVLITSVFGPAQVLSRLTNMVFGKNFPATSLAIVAAVLLPFGTAVLVLTAPSIPGAVLFALLFGLGSGLTSIVSGSLPLQLFGRERYGTRLGWLSSARQVASAVAPFAMAVVMGLVGVPLTLWIAVAIGIIPVVVFAGVAAMTRSSLPAPTPRTA